MGTIDRIKRTQRYGILQKQQSISEKELLYTVANDIGGSATMKDHKQAIISTGPKIKKLLNTYINLMENSPSTWETQLFTSLRSAELWVNS